MPQRVIAKHSCVVRPYQYAAAGKYGCGPPAVRSFVLFRLYDPQTRERDFEVERDDDSRPDSSNLIFEVERP